NARALFESELASLLGKNDPDWASCTLGEDIDLLPGFAFKSKAYTTNDQDVRLLRGDNIVPGALRWADVMRWPSSQARDYAKYELHAGDVVVAMDRPWVKTGLKHAMI